MTAILMAYYKKQAKLQFVYTHVGIVDPATGQ